jgi:pullulanase
METLQTKTTMQTRYSPQSFFQRSFSKVLKPNTGLLNRNHKPLTSKIHLKNSKKRKVRIHYKRFGNDYDGWNLWVWSNKNLGESINFTKQDPFGRVATLELDDSSKELNFLLRKNNWQEKDIHIERKINTSYSNKDGITDVYLVQNEPKVFYNIKDLPKHLKIENYFGNDLGVQFNRESIGFRVWAPTADKAELLLYKQDLGGSPSKVIPMTPASGSTWEVELPKDIEGTYYTYSIDGREAVDPYAHAVGANGQRGQIIDLKKTNPRDWHKDYNPVLENKTDAVIYELHPRHFTIDGSSGVQPSHRGKFLGLIQEGTKSPHNLSTGIDHLKELGVTHVQIMPSFDFGSVDETAKNLDRGNWGYDPLNWNVPEGSYSTNPHNGDVRIREFKQMVKGFHDNGIGVIMDVVYPHTHQRETSHLNKIVPDYYYRKTQDGNYANGSGCGNEIASEKPMARKLIVDSVLHWAKEYHVDGFRFDQMSLLDKDTMSEIRERLDKEVRPNILIYGEGWDRSHAMAHHKSAHRENMALLRGMGFFNNEYSNAIRGDFNGNGDRGLAHGNPDKGDRLTYGLKGDVTPHASPEQSLNYVGCHDNLTFWDNLNKTYHASYDDKIKAFKLGYALTLVSQGIPFISEGDEFLRSKNGLHNAYKTEDSINKLDWHNKEHHKHIHEYLKGLIQLRKTYPAFRIPNSNEILGKVHTSHDTGNKTIKMILDGHANRDPIRKFEVLVNYGNHPKEVHLSENRKWTVLVNDQRASSSELYNFNGNKYVIPAKSMIVLADSESYDKMIGIRRRESSFVKAKMLKHKPTRQLLSL